MRYDAYNNPVGVTGTANFDTTGIASSLREGRLKDDGSTERATVNGGGTGASYVVQRYDTLRGIARAAYGDETLWYVIAEANALPGNVTPPAGTVIQLPAVTRSSNSASTFAVYNPADAIGDTSPAQIEPPPPPAQGGKGCGNVGKLIMVVVVVAVVVAVYTAGAAAGLLGVSGAGGTAVTAGSLGSAALTGGATATAVTGGTVGLTAGGALGLEAALGVSAAIGGAVGSAASQLVGMAIGEVDQFSWKNVGLAALGAGVTSALGGVANGIASGFKDVAGGKYLAAAANGVIRSTVTQGLGSALGLQSFDWKAIAVSAVTSPLNAGINDGISSVAGSALKVMGETFSSGLLGVINGATAQAVRMQVYSDGKIDWASIASDAFGNAIGNSVVETVNYQSTLLAFEERLRTLANRGPSDYSSADASLRPVSLNGIDYNDLAASDLLAQVAGGRYSPDHALEKLQWLADGAVSAFRARNQVWDDDSAAVNAAVALGRTLNNGVELAGSVKDSFVAAWGGMQRFGAALVGADFESAQKMISGVVSAVSDLPAELGRRAMGAFEAVEELVETAQVIAADPQIRGQVQQQVGRVWAAMGKAQAAMGAADLVFAVGMTALGGTAVRAAGEVAGQIATRQKFIAAELRDSQADDLMASFAGALTKVAAASLTRRSVSVALRHGMSSEQLGAIFSTQVYQAAAKRSALEGAGVLHAIIRMENQGWKLLDRNFTYNGGSGHGIDLVFTRQDKGVTRYGIVEAKAGTDLRPDGTIRLDNARTAAGYAMQGSREYNIDRLTKLAATQGTSTELRQFASRLVGEYGRPGIVETYASFARTDRLLQIDNSVRVRSDMVTTGSNRLLNWLQFRRT